MMDINKVREAFLQYVKAYDHQDEKVMLKVTHTLRVAQNAQQIAAYQKLAEDEIRLAYVIGLLHDIGRFEQLRIYHTFFDAKSVDHAAFGVQVLKQDALLEQLCGTTKDADLIYKAIENHNRYTIQHGLTTRELLHARILRDADKTDIFQVHLMQSSEAMMECTLKELCSDTISDDIYAAFMEGKLIHNKQRKTHADVLISHLAMIFDIYHEEAIHLIKTQGAYEALLQKYSFHRPETIRTYEAITRYALQYLNQRSKTPAISR